MFAAKPSSPAAGLFLSLLCILPATQARARESPSDSLAYFQLKDKLLQADSAAYAAYVAAADELAQMGMYEDARALLHDLASQHLPPDSSAQPATPAADSLKRRVQVSVTLGTDYFDMNDVVPSSNEAEEKERNTMLRHQYLAYLRGRMEWSPETSVPMLVAPEAYVGNRKASLGLAAKMGLFGQRLRIDAKLGAEKPFWDDYTSYDSLVAFQEDSCDMASSALRIAFAERMGETEWRFEIPVSFQSEQYRENTPAFTSFILYAAAPRLEYAPDDLAKTAVVGCDVQYKDYAPVMIADTAAGRPVTVADDSSDWALVRPHLELSSRWERVGVDAAVAYSYSRYPNGVRPRRFDQMSTDLAFVYRFNPRFKAKLAGQHVYEAGFYQKTVTLLQAAGFGFPTDSLVRLTLNGNLLELAPEMTAAVAGPFEVSAWVKLKKGMYPAIDTLGGRRLAAPQFLTESFWAWEPGIEAAVENATANAHLRCSLRNEDVESDSYDARDDYRALRIGGDTYAGFLKRFSVYAVADCELKLYKELARPTTNISVSAGLGARF